MAGKYSQSAQDKEKREIDAYAKAQDKKNGVDREAQKKRDFKAQGAKQDSKMSGLTTLFRAGVGAITGQDSEEMKKLKKGLGGR